MTPQLFQIGQTVICKDEYCIAVNPKMQGIPSVFYNNLYVIKEYDKFEYEVWWVSVVGLPEGCVYSEDSFRSLISVSEEIEVSLEETFSADLRK